MSTKPTPLATDAQRALADGAPIGVLQSSLAGELLYANRSIRRALGFPMPGELEAVGLASRIHDHEQRARWLTELERDGHADHGTLVMITRSNQLRSFLVAATLDEGVITEWAMDVTTLADEGHQLELMTEALRSSETRFRSFIEQSPDVVVAHRHGRVIYINPRVHAVLGYERDEVLGRSVLDFVHPDDRPTVIERVQRLMAGNGPAPPLEERYVHKDGTTIWLEVAALPSSFDGEPAVVAIGRDVTARKQLNARLMQTDRLASVGTLAGGVAHEINNPLAGVIANLGFIETCLDDLGASTPSRPSPTPPTAPWLAELRRALADACQGADRVRRIVRDLQLFSGPETQGLGPVPLDPVIDAALNLTQNEIRHRARLVTERQPMPAVLGTEAGLCQVLVNLLVNASEALPDEPDRNDEIRLTATVEGGFAVVDIEDTGCGMAPQALAQLFQPFYTTKPPGSGTGLGLSVCHGIVKASGGEISVQSKPGKGSRFRVRLPAVAGTIDTPPPARSSAAPPGRRARILIVDDEPIVGRSVARALSADHDVEAAFTAREALARIMQTTYDLILCDVLMPEMDGAALYDELARVRPDSLARIMFMSAGTFTPSARLFLERVPNERMPKPTDNRELLRRVAAWLEEHGLVDAR